MAVEVAAATQAAARRMRRTLDDAGASVAGRRVLALCSGGADSVALVSLLAELPRGAAPRSVDVLWLDHGLRARDVAAHDAAAAVAGAVGARLHERQHAREPVRSDGGRQAGARAWRYEVAAQVAREIGCDVVATGHTATDQVEHALLTLTGVTGAGEVGAMPVLRDGIGGIPVVRPLLGLARGELELHLHERGLTWVEDPSNADPRAGRRNALRHAVVPAMLELHPGTGSALLRAGERSRERVTCARALADALLDAWNPDEHDRLDRRRLRALPPPARRELVAAWLRRAGLGRALTSRVVSAVDALAARDGAPPDARVDLADRACVRRDGYDLVLTLDTAGASQP